MTEESTDDTEFAPEPDPRIEDLRRRLSEALLEVNHGEYFRSRIHGWVAYRDDVDVVLPVGIAGRLKSPFPFDRNPGDADEMATLDAFVIAYHAAESWYRLLFALFDGSRTTTASALIAMVEMKAGAAFNKRVEHWIGLPDESLTKMLDFLFLPEEVKDEWPDEGATIEEVQEYLRLWCRHLGHFLGEWRNAYNAAKHGLAVGARPTQFTFVPNEPPMSPVELGNGPMLRTVEHAFQKDDDDNDIKINGQKVLRWFWMYRSVDPDELIARAIVTADLLDWLRAIARSRHLKEVGIWVPIRAEPKPCDLQRPTSPMKSFEADLAAFPLSPEQASEVLARLGRTEVDEEAEEGSDR
ncbi:hypothetical protein F0U44_02750 [Nocardioides humilatus]|uniref:Uncharacterized protein n=1 Tax=Nocardioides humilatus TaxID=2607660 RepID=A0A5B1LMD5_9ACTN|nr:hypothetical protein [Nocardioides humilatus]KAA1421248.1 hypothetical protein F0U44_02750 [Nocardioides humilatus]